MDAEDRENEGDFICAAEKVTPEIVNFMITHGRGQLCMPILPEVADRLDLPPIVEEQHGPVADGLHRAGRSSQLPHGHHRAGAGADDPRDPQSADASRPISCGPAISIRWWPRKAACCGVPGIPSAPSIWPGWPD